MPSAGNFGGEMNEKCLWKKVYDGRECGSEMADTVYTVGCNRNDDAPHWFDSGGVNCNHFKFCPYCGREIEVKDEMDR